MASDYSLFNTILIWVYWGLLVCIPLFVFLGGAQLLVAIIQWRSEKRIGRLKRAGVFFVLAALMPVAIFGLWRGILRPSMAAELMARSQKRIADASVLQVGSQVNDFHTKLSSLGFPSDRPKVTVLNFFATWCGPCLNELPHLQQIADKFADEKDVVFVVVGREESQETLDEFASQNGYRMPFVADKEGSLYREFAKTIIPRTYVIDQTGTIQFEIIGFDQEKLSELDAKISELVEE
jgi:thiol-disulfide isomerase/thioredoxin